MQNKFDGFIHELVKRELVPCTCQVAGRSSRHKHMPTENSQETITALVLRVNEIHWFRPLE